MLKTSEVEKEKETAVLEDRVVDVGVGCDDGMGGKSSHAGMRNKSEAVSESNGRVERDVAEQLGEDLLLSISV